ncbi:MAG: hypothetical protein EOO42_15800 [Flavobacteriales bacterium]|nr:MAG: hypothetical protein EOO42_15800 [Flavobacteriales bacterium]
MEKYTESLAASNGWNTIAHNLDTTGLVVSLYRKDTRTQVELGQYKLVIVDNHSIQIQFGSPIPAEAYWVVIVG